MATLQFSRDTKVYIQQGDGGTIWEVPVQDGFSFSQATNATEITLNEMESSAGVSRRSRQMFNDSFAPAEWSFSTYVRPNNGSAVEEALWANMISQATYSGTWGPSGSVTKSSPNTVFDFVNSNKSALGTFNIWFVLGACGQDDEIYTNTNQTIYKISNSVVNSLSIDFEIDGIAMLNWSGFGKIISEETNFNGSLGIDTGVDATDNFIRNRLTSLSLVRTDDASNKSYSVTLTGGNITIENNITYLIPETLCTVNQPLEHVTGTRTISGNFTCYLDNTSTQTSGALFKDLIGDSSSIRNEFQTTFYIGGTTGTPRVEFYLPKAHLEIPAHSIEDVISVETAFHGLPTDLNTADEIKVTYVGAGSSASAPTATVTVEGVSPSLILLADNDKDYSPLEEFSYKVTITSEFTNDLDLAFTTTNVEDGVPVFVTIDDNVYSGVVSSNSATVSVPFADVGALFTDGADTYIYATITNRANLSESKKIRVTYSPPA